jgi:hypothetical protein
MMVCFTPQEMSVFARHAGGLRCLAWVPEVPGGFVTVSDRNGVIRMWNVSQTAPVELLKTGKVRLAQRAWPVR